MNDTLTCSMPVFKKVKTEGGTHSSSYTIVNGKYSDSFVGKSTDRINLEDEVLLDYSFVIDLKPGVQPTVSWCKHEENVVSSLPLSLKSNLPIIGGKMAHLHHFNMVRVLDHSTCYVVADFEDNINSEEVIVLNAMHYKGLEEIRATLKVKQVMRNLLSLQKAGEYKKATKEIFAQVGEYLTKGNFLQLANLLSSLPFEKLEGKLQVAFLSVTNPWKKESAIRSVREQLLKITNDTLVKEIGEERAGVILKGLR